MPKDKKIEKEMKLPDSEGLFLESILAESPYPFDSYAGQASMGYAASLTLYLTEEFFTTGDLGLGISRRLINYWDSEELLTSKRSEGEKWRRYSFVEYVWLHIIRELREVNYPLSALRVVKKTLMAPLPLKKWLKELKKKPDLLATKSEDEEQMKALLLGLKKEDEDKLLDIPQLALLMVESILMKKNIALVVLPGGKWLAIEAGKEHTLPENIIDILTYKTYVRVSLTALLKEFMNDKLAAEFLPKLNILHPREQMLLEIIGSGEFEHITVHYKDRPPEYLEANKTPDIKKRVVDILQENQYQQVVIKRHQGVTTTIENTVRYAEDKKQRSK